MKKLIFIFTVLVTMLLLVSCIMHKERITFDQKKFDMVKAAWKEQNLKNYSFSYKMYICPYWKPLLIKGNVTVKDGKGSVTFEKEKDFAGYNRHPDYPIPREGSHYHITCMEDIFDGFYNFYLADKERAEKDNSLVVWYFFSYDETYFYIANAHGDINKRRPPGVSAAPTGVNSSTYSLTVSDFKITE